MNKIRPELLERIRKSNEEYKKIESPLKPLGFTLCTGAVFYGERPFSIYCGKMKDYRSFIDSIDSIRERYRKRKNESLGIYETRSQKQHPQNRSDTVLHKKKKDI